MQTHFKRWLFLGHRWLGIGACAFFAMWFVSGVVMMYSGHPKLTNAERLAHLPPLGDAAGLLPPRQALDAAGVAGALRELRLAVASGGRAVYLATQRDAVVVVDARTAEVLRRVDAARVLASAAAWAGPGVGATYLGPIDEDAHTHSRALDGHRPLHRVRLSDAQGTLLYVSGRTAEVVRDATRRERAWNYAGAWIHWLYPLRGTVLDRHWAAIVNGLSLLGIVVALSGTVVGVMRWRLARPYRSGSCSPYPGRAMRWHHYTGLCFALATITWIFSGLMSMNPWRVFDRDAPALRVDAMNGGPLRVDARHAAPAAVLAAAGGDVRELRWVRVLGHDTVVAERAAGRPALVDALGAQPRRIDDRALRAGAARLIDAPVVRVDRLEAYDLHYYAREPHTMTGGSDRPLPVLRVVYGDAHASWVHLDPHTAAVLGRSDSGRRLGRWLFAMLHSWDWLPLLQRRPLWDLVMVGLSAGGAALSVTGMVIGWRRLRRRIVRRRVSPGPGAAPPRAPGRAGPGQ